MSNMQQFYQRLAGPVEVFDPYFQGLAQLKQADRETVLTLASQLEWFNWAAAEGDPPPAV